MTKKTHVDVAIFGGGIAGLWALNRLRAEGYNAVLFEANTLGGGQTIKSQGIIHGGIKYALTGALTGASQAIANMPKRWRDCLQGSADVDLRKVNILSEEQLLWSTGSLTSDITGFFASKALKSRVQKLKRDDYPLLLKNAKFKGNVYRLEEIVLDNPSLIEALAMPQYEYIFKVDKSKLYFEFEKENAGDIEFLRIESIDNQKNIDNEAEFKSKSESEFELHITAKRFLFTAGEGNQAITQNFEHTRPQQCRPLQMVVVQLDEAYPFFAHCLDSGMNPRVTITSHKTQNGKFIWYIGGQLAEDGVKRSQTEQIDAARKELASLFPWLDLKNAKWGSFYINRAEPKQADGKRPDLPFLQTNGNVMTGWPTKLALTPLFVDNLLAALKEQNITPAGASLDLTVLNHLSKPAIAKPVWDEIFESSFL